MFPTPVAGVHPKFHKAEGGRRTGQGAFHSQLGKHQQLHSVVKILPVNVASHLGTRKNPQMAAGGAGGSGEGLGGREILSLVHLSACLEAKKWESMATEKQRSRGWGQGLRDTPRRQTWGGWGRVRTSRVRPDSATSKWDGKTRVARRGYPTRVLEQELGTTAEAASVAGGTDTLGRVTELLLAQPG